MNNKLSKTNEENGIKYNLKGDYYFPNLTIPKQEKIILNKYGRMRLKYLKKYKKAEYTIMLMDGTLNAHLKEIQEIAEKRVHIIIKELEKHENMIEKLKENNQIEWVKTMNNIKNRAEEIIYNEIIYS